MPQRTLITTLSGIGLGILGQRFAEYFTDCWDRVIAFPTRPDWNIALSIKHPRLLVVSGPKSIRALVGN